MSRDNIPTDRTSISKSKDSTDTHTHETRPSTPEPKPETQPTPLPISDLVYDLSPKPTSSIPKHFSSIHTSKHATDFRVRNQTKILRLSDILSDLSMHLATAKRKEDQPAFDLLYARIVKAGDGLESLAQPELERSEGGGNTGLQCGEGESWGWWVNGQEVAGSYTVQHGNAGEEGEEYEELSKERVASASREYEAKLERQVKDVREDAGDEDLAGSSEDGEDEGKQSEEFESQETTLVEGLEELEPLHSTLSVALDGGGGKHLRCLRC